MFTLKFVLTKNEMFNLLLHFISYEELPSKHSIACKTIHVIINHKKHPQFRDPLTFLPKNQTLNVIK